jgi:hypothetical protein
VTLKILGVDGQAEGVTLVAQFNPKEVVVDKSVNWSQAAQDPSSIAFIGSGPTTMAFELMFDGFETGTSVQPQVAKLHQLSDVDPTLKRPPKVRVAYGAPRAVGVIPQFDGVIEALMVKYVMFNESGVAVRATVSLRIREADKIKIAAVQP